MADLLPCPFCGGEADFGQQIGGYFVNCVECLASTNVIVDHRLTKQEAADKWNTRALSAPPPAVAPQGWQPIATAPKDGTPILLDLGMSHQCGYAPSAWPRKRIALGYFDKYWVVSLVGENSDGSHAGSTGGNDDQFTGWQPLPTAPEKSNG